MWEKKLGRYNKLLAYDLHYLLSKSGAGGGPSRLPALCAFSRWGNDEFLDFAIIWQIIQTNTSIHLVMVIGPWVTSSEDLAVPPQITAPEHKNASAGLDSVVRRSVSPCKNVCQSFQLKRHQSQSKTMTQILIVNESEMTYSHRCNMRVWITSRKHRSRYMDEIVNQSEGSMGGLIRSHLARQ